MEETGTIQERIKKIIRENNTNPRQMAINATIDPSYFAKFLKGKVGLTLENMEKISALYNVDLDWIRGTNVDNSPNSKGLLLKEESIHYKRRNLKNTTTEQTLMFYNIGANAGTPHAGEILPVKKNEGVLHISDLFKGSQYAIRVSGNSMMPNYPPGAIIG